MSRQSRQAGLPPFLLTRPALQGARFSDQLRARFGGGIRVIASPLLAPRFLDAVVPDREFAGVIFTSETGVAGFRRLSAETHGVAWCVGDRTAQAARAAGFSAQSAGGDANALVAAIRAAGQRGPLLHVRGREAIGGVTEALNLAGIETVSSIVYVQELQPLSGEAQAILKGAAAVIAPVFSPRTAAILAALPEVQSRQSALWIAALSPNVAAAAAPARPERIATATLPDADALLDAVARIIAAASEP